MNNIYEHIKMCIFCVLSLVKPTKMSWNFLKIGSWNFTSCCWEPWVWCTNYTGKTTTSFFNTISIHISTIATLAKKLPHSSQIEILRHAVEIRLRGSLDLIIVAKPLSMKMFLQMSK